MGLCIKDPCAIYCSWGTKWIHMLNLKHGGEKGVVFVWVLLGSVFKALDSGLEYMGSNKSKSFWYQPNAFGSHSQGKLKMKR